MFEALIRALIMLCLIVAAFFIALWVFAQLGIVLPAIVITIAKVILVLICILYLYRMLKPVAGGWIP
jgi:hypothetical protein